uniref:Uncharacterized protein n=1 Tax=Anopheles culicifacies TaxID=139723 RepID=A0A182MC63_9DIPT
MFPERLGTGFRAGIVRLAYHRLPLKLEQHIIETSEPISVRLRILIKIKRIGMHRFRQDAFVAQAQEGTRTSQTPKAFQGPERQRSIRGAVTTANVQQNGKEIGTVNEIEADGSHDPDQDRVRDRGEH